MRFQNNDTKLRQKNKRNTEKYVLMFLCQKIETGDEDMSLCLKNWITFLKYQKHKI